MLDYKKLYHKLKDKEELVWIREEIVQIVLPTYSQTTKIHILN